MTDVDMSPLFKPFRIKDMVLQSHFVMTAMNRGWTTADGLPDAARYASYYSDRAARGIGLVITGSFPIDHPSSSALSDPLINARSVEPWSGVTAAVRAAGGHTFLQLWHEGAIRLEGRGPYPNAPTLSPSGLAQKGRTNGRAATIDELAEIRDAYVQAALIAQASGFSGVEIHSAHGYFLDQFLWPETNQRTDRYGGSTVLERATYAIEVVCAIRAAVGPDYPISFRFSQWKEVDFDAKIMDVPSELEGFLAALREAGVDLFNCSSRYFWKPEVEGSPLNLAGWAKKFTDVPVLTCGSLGLKIDLFGGLLTEGQTFEFAGAAQLETMMQKYRNGEFDLMGIGRSIIGDADWLTKVRNGRYADIRSFSKNDIMGNVDWDPGLVGETHGVDAEALRR